MATDGEGERDLADPHAWDPVDERPLVTEPYHTADLPPLPQRDRTMPARLWVEAPAALRQLGDDIGQPVVAYKRKIGRWFLWRAGPPAKGDARYLAVDSEDLSRHYAFRLFPDGRGEGTGPSGRVHDRFRTWKEDLRDSG